MAKTPPPPPDPPESEEPVGARMIPQAFDVTPEPPVEPAAAPVVEYPRWLYHTTGDRRLVQTPDEGKALGSGWTETPPAAKE